ncbi:MAG: 3-dehydroquinate synthase, partial [Planctomycetota bacterium]
MKVTVRAPGGTYPVTIAEGAIERLPALFSGSVFRSGKKPSSLFLITDSKVRRHHGARVEALLRETGIPISTVPVPAGEGSKSAAQLERIWRAVLKKGADRRACFVALGGGMIGDLTGFA